MELVAPQRCLINYANFDTNSMPYLLLFLDLQATESRPPWNNITRIIKMADIRSLTISPGLKKNLNKTRKRKINIAEWQDETRKTMRQAGQSYVSRSGVLIRQKTPPNEVRGRTFCFLVGIRHTIQVNVSYSFFGPTLQWSYCVDSISNELLWAMYMSL